MSVPSSPLRPAALALVLLVAGLPLAAPPAAASHATPGAGLPDVFADAGDVRVLTFAGTSSHAAHVFAPADGAVRYNTTYDVTFTNISTSGGPSGPGYGPASQTTGFRFVTPLGFIMPNPRDAVPDGAHGGKWNVTFPSQMFNVTGFWQLEDGAGVDVVRFLVQPEETLTVSLSQSSFAYTSSNVSFLITVSSLAAGQTATLEGPGIPPNTYVTGPSGQYIFSGQLPGAGASTVHANRSVDGDAIPEVTGRGTYVVQAAPLTVTPVDVGARVNYSKVVKFNLTYPNGSAVFCPNAAVNCAGGLSLADYNLSVNFSQGTLYANASTTSPTVCFWTAAAGCAPPPSGTVFSFDTSGQELGVFSFRPGATWPAGVYQFSLRVNAKGPTGTLPEFVSSWSFVPATPAPVNLDLSGIASGAPGPTGSPVALSNLSVIENVSGTGPAGRYTLFLTISGDNENEHPTTSAPTASRNVIDSFGPSNVSLSGAVLLHDTLGSGFSYNPSTGVATLSGVSPTRVGGDVAISVTWKGLTTTRILPIVNGATLTVTPAVIPVNATTTVTFTVRDAVGNPIPDARLLLWEMPSGAADGCAKLCGPTVIHGFGGPGSGQNGMYNATYTPGAAGTFVAYAVIGQGPAPTDSRRFAYATLTTANILPPCSWDDAVCAFEVGLLAAAGAREDGARFGVHENATSGYDEGLDALEPPAPADPDFVQASFSYPANGPANASLHRSLLGPAPTATWPLALRTGAPNASTTLTWDAEDVAQVDARYDVELLDGATVVDMRAATGHATTTDANGQRALTLRVRQAADLRIVANATFVTPVVSLGANLTGEVTLANDGALPANATLTLRIDGAAAHENVTLGVIPPGGVATFALPPTPQPLAGEHTARIEVATVTVERTLANNAIELPYFVAHHLVDVTGGGAQRGLNGTTLIHHANVTNLGNAQDTFTLAVHGVPAGWTATLSAPVVTLDPNETAPVLVTVQVPEDVLTPNATAFLRLVATSSADATGTDQVAMTTTMLARHATTLADGWSMVSLPVTPDDASVEAVFGDAADVVYEWTGAAYAPATTVLPGRGYWVLSLGGEPWEVVGVPLRRTSTTLMPGWNLVGAALAPTDLALAPPNVARTAWTWGPTGYVESDTLAPGVGYWLHVDGPQPASLRMGLSFGVPQLFRAYAAAPDRDPAFLVPVDVTQPGGARDGAAFGAAEDATAGYDRGYDAHEPPQAAAPGAVRAWMQDAAAGGLHRSVVPTGDAMAWTLHVETDAPTGGVAMLRWSRADLSDIPATYRVHLTDGLVRVDMRAADAHAFTVPQGHAVREFLVVVERDDGVCLVELDGACLLASPADPLRRLGLP